MIAGAVTALPGLAGLTPLPRVRSVVFELANLRWVIRFQGLRFPIYFIFA